MYSFLRVVSDWDIAICRSMASMDERKLLDLFMRLISRMGDGYAYAVLFLVIGFTGGSDARIVVYTAVVGFSLNLSAYWIIKKAIRRPRPFTLIEDIGFKIPPPDEFSFPSGHTSCAFLVAGILPDLFPGLWFLSYAFAVLVGFSRIYNGVHFPTDVLAGASMGMFFAYVAGLIIS